MGLFTRLVVRVRVAEEPLADKRPRGVRKAGSFSPEQIQGPVAHSSTLDKRKPEGTASPRSVNQATGGEQRPLTG